MKSKFNDQISPPSFKTETGQDNKSIYNKEQTRGWHSTFYQNRLFQGNFFCYTSKRSFLDHLAEG